MSRWQAIEPGFRTAPTITSSAPSTNATSRSSVSATSVSTAKPSARTAAKPSTALRIEAPRDEPQRGDLQDQQRGDQRAGGELLRALAQDGQCTRDDQSEQRQDRQQV